MKPATDKSSISKGDANTLIALFNQSRFAECVELARGLTQRSRADGLPWKVLGAALQAQGLCEDAVPAMQEAARLAPHDADAYSNLGGVLTDLGRFTEAETAHRRALSLTPKSAHALVAYAVTLRSQGKWSDAAKQLRLAIRVEPRDARAHAELGVCLFQLKELNEAEAALRKALLIAPNFPEALCNLGVVLKHLERQSEAEQCYRKALALNSGYIDAWYNLGCCLYAQNRLAEAENVLRQALTLAPNHLGALNNLGNALEAQGRFAESRSIFERAIELAPDFAEAHCNLGNSLRYLGLMSEAEASYRRALCIKQDLPDAHHYLGYVLARQQRYAEAEASYREAQTYRQQFPEMLTNLGHSLMLQGRFAEAEPNFREALRLRPDLAIAQSALLFYKNYTESDSVEHCLDEARRYGEMIDVPNERFTTWSCDRQPARLRVGLVSGNLNSHPVGHFLEGMLRHIDRERVELIAYSNHYRCDDLTQRIKPAFAHWREIHGLRDTAAAELIHRDAPHVLLDLAGHTGDHRLPIFARRPAPTQATWLGYFATTGVAQMDYLIGDPFVTPTSEESHFTERVWRLPDSYLCFTAPNVEVEPGELPALRNGFITFGCFNNLAKLNDAVLTLWSKILAAVPTAQLLLRAPQLTDPHMVQSMRERFAALGVANERLILEGQASRAEWLASYRRVDIALDPFPYPGGTTSTEALWMGVPVITRQGTRFLSHVGESIAHNAGMSNWIATDNDAYLQLAINATHDLAQLASLRANLRAQVLAAPIFDAPRFAANFVDALFGMWSATGAKR